MVTPSGRRNSEPVPVPNASGRAPNSAAMVVIMMGRKRSRQAWRMASSGFLRSVRCATRAKSIIMMAFFFTMPIRRMMPMTAMTSNGILHSCSASSAPMPAEGRVERIVIGCT